MAKRKIQLVKLSNKTDLILFLISAELKSSKFFNTLGQAGLEDCYYQLDFCAVVLSYSGFEQCPDDLVSFYIKLVDKYSARIEADRDSVTKYALKFYIALMAERKRRAKLNLE